MYTFAVKLDYPTPASSTPENLNILSIAGNFSVRAHLKNGQSSTNDWNGNNWSIGYDAAIRRTVIKWNSVGYADKVIPYSSKFLPSR